MTRWGIIATGKIADAFATTVAAMDDANVVAVSSRDSSAADAFANRHGIPNRHEGHEALLADQAVDAVYIATPNHLHGAQTIAALEAGKPVLVEKPFALDHAEALAMVDTARRHEVFLMEALWSRFLPHVRLIRETIESGTLGHIRVVEANFGFPAPFDPASRLFALEMGGGSLLDIGIYPVTLAVLVLGYPDTVEAWAHVGSTGVDEQTGIVFGYEDGRMAILHSSVTAFTSNEATISGTDAYLRIPHPAHHPKSMSIHREDEPIVVLDCSYPSTGYQYEIAEVQRCLEAGLIESPIMPLDESLAMMSLLDRIRSQIGVSQSSR